MIAEIKAGNHTYTGVITEGAFIPFGDGNDAPILYGMSKNALLSTALAFGWTVTFQIGGTLHVEGVSYETQTVCRR